MKYSKYSSTVTAAKYGKIRLSHFLINYNKDIRDIK